jgi:hypothetical protein
VDTRGSRRSMCRALTLSLPRMAGTSVLGVPLAPVRAGLRRMCITAPKASDRGTGSISGISYAIHSLPGTRTTRRAFPNGSGEVCRRAQPNAASARLTQHGRRRTRSDPSRRARPLLTLPCKRRWISCVGIWNYSTSDTPCGIWFDRPPGTGHLRDV